MPKSNEEKAPTPPSTTKQLMGRFKRINNRLVFIQKEIEGLDTLAGFSIEFYEKLKQFEKAKVGLEKKKKSTLEAIKGHRKKLLRK